MTGSLLAFTACHHGAHAPGARPVRTEGATGARADRTGASRSTVAVAQDGGRHESEALVAARRAIVEALEEARGALYAESGEEGPPPEWGCRGYTASRCARERWAALARAGVGYAAARCGAAVAREVAAWRRLEEAYTAREDEHGHALARVMEFPSSRPVPASFEERERETDSAADEAFGPMGEAAAEAMARCGVPARLTALGALVANRDEAALGPFRWSE